ncbi:MAG: tetratricopeptide repeat protein [Xanthomonadales bacterium]|nr:tetratricopeptide repeat protein [Xanthomonadales bacterium]
MKELRKRRVLPAIGVYVASCWVGIEILDRLTERYGLSPYLTDLVFWGLFSLIPAVCILSWAFGRPGKDTATRAVKIGVPLNVLATAALLIALFSGKDLGRPDPAAASAPRVTADTSTAEPVPEESLAPEPAERQRLGMFFYRNETGDPELDWLRYGATNLLEQDLDQDPYLAIASPHNNWISGYYGRLAAAGFEDGVNAPATLMREIARDSNRQYFIDGSIRREGEDLVLVTRLWDVNTLAQREEIVQRGWNLFDMLDRTSVAIREALGVPSLERADYEDLPLAETYGESQKALQLYLEGLNVRMVKNDLSQAAEFMDAALEADPAFVMAMMYKGQILLETGDMAGAQQYFGQAENLDYRLPSSDRAVLRAAIYRVTGQTDKLIGHLRLQVKLTGEARWHQQLGGLLMANGELEEAREQFRLTLEKDSQNTGLYLVLSDLERSLGNMEGAIENARRYQEARPGDMDANLKLGELMRDSGDLDAAEALYQEALLMDDDSVQPPLKLHLIAARRGESERARRYLEQALEIAKTPGQLALVHSTAATYEARLGRIGQALGQLRAAQPYLAESQPPYLVALQIHTGMVDLILHLDDVEGARAILDEARALVPQPPLSLFLEPANARILGRVGDIEAAQASLDEFESVMLQLGFRGVLFQVPLVGAQVAADIGDHEQAVRLFEQTLEEIDESFIAGQMYDAAVPDLMGLLANEQVAAGQLESAALTIERGLDLDPTSPELWLAQGRLHKARGEDAEARVAFERVLDTWSDADPELLRLQQAETLLRETTQAGA